MVWPIIARLGLRTVARAGGTQWAKHGVKYGLKEKVKQIVIGKAIDKCDKKVEQQIKSKKELFNRARLKIGGLSASALGFGIALNGVADTITTPEFIAPVAGAVVGTYALGQVMKKRPKEPKKLSPQQIAMLRKLHQR